MTRKDCPECGGTGWKPVEADGVQYVARCGCRHTERTRQLLEQARIPRRYQHCAFENFDIRRQLATGQPNQMLHGAKLKAQGFVREYPLDYGLLFVGPTGVGKTHLAVSILRELIAKGFAGLFYEFGSLLKEIQDSYNPISKSSELRVLAPVYQADVLVLDELGATVPTE